eukprot:1191292-Prorocentrum_minimum.AAC.2
MAAAKLHSGDSLHKVRVANAAEDDLIKNAATPALKLSAACFVEARTKLRASVEEERDDDTQVTIFYYPHAPRDEQRRARGKLSATHNKRDRDGLTTRNAKKGESEPYPRRPRPFTR